MPNLPPSADTSATVPTTPKTSATLPVNGSAAWRWYGLAVLTIIIDQLTKQYFVQHYTLYESHPVIPPVLNWTLAYNKGAAFSFLADKGGWQIVFFSVLALAVATAIAVYLRRVPQQARWLSLGLAWVMGGALGNVIDRIRYGHVIDFIHVHYADVWNYPIFNVADMAICGGVALILLDTLFLENRRKAAVV
ncbi:signal peptidase II [Moraxella atlantae]|uniref:signal peptidase II n=1 Tax=Faucicola atlantae TaxID=34059 RepID=UPI003751FEDE